MLRFKIVAAATVTAAFLVASLPASAAKLSLVPGVYNPGELEGISAQWVNLKTTGKAKALGQQVLKLEKNQPTSADAAAGADVVGIAGTPVDMLKGLCWTVVDGHCGAGAPRWNIYLDADKNGELDTVVFLGCMSAGEDGCFTADEIAAAVAATGAPADAPIMYLQIIFDEGNDVGPGYVVLKNVAVTVGDYTKVFNAANSKPAPAKAQKEKTKGGKK